MVIKVFGLGCPTCKEVERMVCEAVEAAHSDATVEKVTGLREMMAAGVLTPPAIAIDGTLVCVGRVPTKKEVMDWIAGSAAN